MPQEGESFASSTIEDGCRLKKNAGAFQFRNVHRKKHNTDANFKILQLSKQLFTIKNSKKMKEQVLDAMRKAGKPVSAGDVTKALGADRKEVDKAFAELKKEGAIVSPVRCKWEPAK